MVFALICGVYIVCHSLFALPQVVEYDSCILEPQGMVLHEKIEKLQNRTARFVTGNCCFDESGSMTGILEKVRWESLKKRRIDSRLIQRSKARVFPAFQQMTLSSQLEAVESSLMEVFRPPLQEMTFTSAQAQGEGAE